MKELDAFFTELMSDTRLINGEIGDHIKLFVGESPYSDTGNLNSISGYPFKQIAFFRADDFEHHCLKRLFNLIVGTKNSIALFDYLKKNNIQQKDLLVYLKDEYQMYFVNLFNSSKCRELDSNYHEIQQFLQSQTSEGKKVDVLLIGAENKAYFPGFVQEGVSKIRAIEHPQRAKKDVWNNFCFQGNGKWNSSQSVRKHFSLIK